MIMYVETFKIDVIVFIGHYVFDVILTGYFQYLDQFVDTVDIAQWNQRKTVWITDQRKTVLITDQRKTVWITDQRKTVWITDQKKTVWITD